MCGRYALYGPVTRTRVQEQYFAGLDEFPATYNAAPGELLPVAFLDGDLPALALLKWGLVPSWARDAKTGFKCINARAETVATNGLFRGAYRSRHRCLVPVRGFYEWQQRATGKQPYYITSAGGELLVFAGLWDEWRPSGGEPLRTFTILTCAAVASVASLHDRMPVIVPEEMYDMWLTAPDAVNLLEPYPAELLRAYPVSTRVNTPRNNDAQLIDPVPAGA